MGQDRQMQMIRGNGGNHFRQYAGQNAGNLNGYNEVQNVRNQAAQNAIQNPRVQNVGNQNGLIGVPGNANQNGNGNLVVARAEGIQLQAEEFDLMAAAEDLDEIEEVNANCILMANLQQPSTSGTQNNKALVYDSNGSAKVYNYENCYNDEIFNMFTQEEQYTEQLEPILEPHQVPQNDNNVISEVTSVEQSGETVEQHPANVEETHLNKQLSKEKSSVFFLLEEKKKLKSDFKIREDKLLDKQIQLEKRIKELDNILVKTGQSIQTIHMLSPKPDSFYHTEQKMALGYQNPFYLKQAQKKQQSLYDGKVLLEKHDPHVVHDSEETLQLAQREANASLAKHKILELEIERLLKAVVSQDIISVVQNASVVDTSDLQTELERAKERFENCIIKKETKYAKLWNDWYKSKLENANVELEFQVFNYARENSHLKATYKNLFDSISVSRVQTETKIASLQNELQSNIYKNTKLRTQLFKKVSDQKDNTQDSIKNTKFAKQPNVEILSKNGKTNALSKPVTSNSVSTPQESKGVNNDKVIARGMFRISPDKVSRDAKKMPNTVSASSRTKP
nr:hypothetical protein [Tanacetum cinerariifolium]